MQVKWIFVLLLLLMVLQLELASAIDKYIIFTNFTKFMLSRNEENRISDEGTKEYESTIGRNVHF